MKDSIDYSKYNSQLIIDLDAVQRNARRVQEYIGPDHGIIGVVKGDGYGYGLSRMGRFLTAECGIECLAVAHICEGEQLRREGIDADILIMTAYPERLIPIADLNGLQLTVFGEDSLDMLERYAEYSGHRLPVHLKINTGMNRIGIRPGEDLKRLLRRISEKKCLDITGVYTHYATGRIFQNEFTLQQLTLFKEGLQQVYDAGFCPKYVHTANSGATMWLKDSYFTHVRFASLFMGYARLKETENDNPIGIEETSSWITEITHVYEVHAGETVGYGRYFRAERDTKIALISVGSNDGLFRDYALHGGRVIVSGHECRYIGICMDSSFIDVTDIDCRIGDRVMIMGNDGTHRITPMDFVSYAPYMNISQVFTSLGPRVEKKYVSSCKSIASKK